MYDFFVWRAGGGKTNDLPSGGHGTNLSKGSLQVTVVRRGVCRRNCRTATAVVHIVTGTRWVLRRVSDYFIIYLVQRFTAFTNSYDSQSKRQKLCIFQVKNIPKDPFSQTAKPTRNADIHTYEYCTYIYTKQYKTCTERQRGRVTALTHTSDISGNMLDEHHTCFALKITNTTATKTVAY